ncbi:MAG TPA: DUF2000 family protein [Trebonia sp.]
MPGDDEHPDGLRQAGHPVAERLQHRNTALLDAARWFSYYLACFMPAAAQAHRVYDDYLAELAGTDPADLGVCAFSVFGPKNPVEKITKKLALLP